MVPNIFDLEIYVKMGEKGKYIRTEKHREKMGLIISDIKKKQFAEGKIKIWCDGLTKETDERVKNYGKKISDTKTKLFQNDEYKKQYLEKHTGCFKKGCKSLRKGITMEQEYGVEKANQLKRKMSLSMKGKYVGKNNPNYGNHILEGSNNPNWQGGIAYLPYSHNFNSKFKEMIKERDTGCLMCNLSIENLNELNRRVLIHHVDYDKTLTIKENCCVLCNGCNSIANFNRVHWTKFFQSLLAERYGYKYTQEQKIILDFEEVYVK